MNGDLAEGVVPQLLREIYVGRRNGSLEITKGAERQSLRFRRGHIVNAHTNVVEERLGEMMVRRGLLSQADLERATAIVIRDRRRLGEVLAELGLTDANRLEDAVALHVHEMLAKVFSWTEGCYAFQEEEDTPGGELTLKLSTGELILEAVQAVRDPDVVHYSLGDLDRVLALSNDPLLRFQQLNLSRTDGFVLSRIDGATSAREVVQMIPLAAQEVERSLFALLSTGLIEYVAGLRRSRKTPSPAEARAQPRRPSASTPAVSAASPPPGERATTQAVPPVPPAAAPVPPPGPTDQPAPARPSAAPPDSGSSPRVVPPPPPPPPPEPAPAPPAVPPAQIPGPAQATATGARVEPAPAASDQADERRREILNAWEGIRTKSHFEILGVARSATEAEVKDAYFRLAKRFHPDVHHGSSLGDLRDELEAVFIRLGEAYDALRDPRRRAEYEEKLGRPQTPGRGIPGTPASAVPPTPAAPPAPDREEDARTAEEAIRRAGKLFEAEKYWDAIQLLDPTVERVQGKAQSKGRILLARCYLKNPNWAKRAEDALLAVTRSDPAATDAWALLGGIYAEKGMQNRALSMYRKALELKPEHEEAARYVAAHHDETPPSGEEGGRGLLNRLFRKP